MKRFFIVAMILGGVFNAKAQEFITVTQACPQCWGYGMVTSYYGPVYCPGCGGMGRIQMTIRNPYYNPNNVSFQGANNDGYIPNGKITLKRVISGTCDTFDYYVKGDCEYVKYKGRYYSLKGNRVTIDNVQYYTR